MSGNKDKIDLTAMKGRRSEIAKELNALERDRTQKGEEKRKQLKAEDNRIWQKIDRAENPNGPFYESEEEKGYHIRTNVARLLGGLL